MSPEQVRGQVVDHRSDIFSLGATLYELISGQRAFLGDSAVDTMSAILKHDPPELSNQNATISPALAAIVRHCLEKEREQRFQSARDLAFALGSTGSGPQPAPIPPPLSVWRRWLIGTGTAAALILGVYAATWLGAPSAAAPPVFQPLTFRRGHVYMARFAPDGHTVVSSASWDGKPSEMLSTRLDTAEASVLPLAEAQLLSVSRSGELAILKDSPNKRVLARVPIGAAGSRDLVANVLDADWAPDGTLAVVRADQRKVWLEFPVGTKIFDPGNAINAVRMSPDGALLAVMEQQVLGGGPEWLTILDRRGSVLHRSQRWASNFQDGLAWTPDGREVWYAASAIAGHTAIQAMTRDGHTRTVHRAMGSVRILDLAADGRALLANDSLRADISLVDANSSGEVDLTWREWSRPTALSNDGKFLTFGNGRTDMHGKMLGFIRATDGSPAVQLTDDGTPKAISPDNQWVVIDRFGSAERTIVPTSVGNSRPLDNGTVVGLSAILNGTRWLPDGQRIVFVGNEAGRPRRVFVQNVRGGLPVPVTPEGAFGPMAVSPDSRLVVVNNPKRQLTQYPIDGGPSAAVAAAEPEDQPLAWGPDGSLWVLDFRTTPSNIFRIEPGFQRRRLWREVPYLDPAFTEATSLRVVMSADGTRFVYGYQKHLSELYVADGLR
jgi:Tol biopolymer transport system component